MEENKVEGIAGTEFKTPEELAQAYLKTKEGYSSLEKKLGEQGNELGTIRQQNAALAKTLESLSAKPEKAAEQKPVRDFDKEEAEIDRAIEELDPADDAYQKKLAQLNRQGRQLAMARQHEMTLAAAGQIFKKELEERDIKTTQKQFLDENPSFSTPEMQAKIKDAMQKDKTGMLDPMAAFYQIQRDEAMAAIQATAAEKDELAKRLELAEGKRKTGTVITGKGPGAPTEPTQRATGKVADEGALAAIRAARGET